MPRKKITRLRKFCVLLEGHLVEQSDRAMQAATELVRRWLSEGEELRDLLRFLFSLGLRLEDDRERLTAIDNQHMHQLQLSRNLRELRDAATAELRQDMIQLKDSLNGLFGTGGANKIFEEAAVIPVDPVALHQLTGHVRDNLGNEAFPMPKPLKKGIKLDREETVRDLEEPYQRLGEALCQLGESESAAKFSQAQKIIQVALVDDFGNKVARFLEAFFDLVGLDLLSDRVRRSSHRAADQPDDSDEGSDEGGFTGGDPFGSAASLPAEDQRVALPEASQRSVPAAGAAVAASG